MRHPATPIVPRRHPIVHGVLYPIFAIILSPMIAAAMSFSPVSVVGNALRLRKVELPAGADPPQGEMKRGERSDQSNIKGKPSPPRYS